MIRAYNPRCLKTMNSIQPGPYAISEDRTTLSSVTLTIEINEADLRPLARAVHVAQALAEHVEKYELKKRDDAADALREHQKRTSSPKAGGAERHRSASTESTGEFDYKQAELLANDRTAASRWRGFKQWTRRTFQKRSRLLRSVLGAEVVATMGIGRESTQTTRRAARVAIQTKQSAVSPRADDVEQRFALLRDDSDTRMDRLEEAKRSSTSRRSGRGEDSGSRSVSKALRDREALVDGLARMADPMDAICAGVAGGPRVVRGAWALQDGDGARGSGHGRYGRSKSTRRHRGELGSALTPGGFGAHFAAAVSPISDRPAGHDGQQGGLDGGLSTSRSQAGDAGGEADVVLTPIAAPGRIVTSIDVEDSLTAKRLLVSGPLCPSTIVGTGLDTSALASTPGMTARSMFGSPSGGPPMTEAEAHEVMEEDAWFEARSWGAKLWKHQLDAMLHGGPPSFVLLHDALLHAASSSGGNMLAQDPASRQVDILRRKLEQVGTSAKLGRSTNQTSQRRRSSTSADAIGSLAAPASLRIDAKAVTASTRTKISALRSGVDAAMAQLVHSGAAHHESKQAIEMQKQRRGSTSSVASLEHAVLGGANQGRKGRSAGTGFSVTLRAPSPDGGGSGRDSAEPGMGDVAQSMHRRGSIAAHHHDVRADHAGIVGDDDAGEDSGKGEDRGVRFAGDPDSDRTRAVARSKQIAARSARHRRGSVATALLAAVQAEHAAEEEERRTTTEDIAVGLQLAAPRLDADQR